ncbi:MAG: histone deacetylase, partial [Candidatus Omnitrophica bacterium]|nr:histone deacetylase [Candidatus Omnitrophota bacterium]
MPGKVRLVYSKDYAVDIGDHVFPTLKYKLIRDRILKDPVLKEKVDFVKPAGARDLDIILAHDEDYLDKLKSGTLTRDEILRMELPFSEKLVYASILCCGGTILATQIALTDSLGIHIGGGFHHAFGDHGEGFCVLNDIAVAVKRLIKYGPVKKALIVDCDLHQGNGTAAIFAGDDSVFTFSIHQENNYPFIKAHSNLDIGLSDGAGDDEYMRALSDNIPGIIKDFRPEFLMYVAGADPYKEDQLGALKLTKDGLRQRDEFVYGQARRASIPVSVVLAGGYAFH